MTALTRSVFGFLFSVLSFLAAFVVLECPRK